MNTLHPSMRIKLKGDTFYVPHEDGGVYFHNNEGSFWMEGRGIDAWLEKLLPLFDGRVALAEITDGLPKAHQERVYDIARALYQNGFAKDTSADPPHGLTEEVMDYFAPQINFIDNLVGQGPSRFEAYRGVKVLAVGYGMMLDAVTSSLFESGLSHVTTLAWTSVKNSEETSEAGINNGNAGRAELDTPKAGRADVEEVEVPQPEPQTGEMVRTERMMQVLREAGVEVELQAIQPNLESEDPLMNVVSAFDVILYVQSTLDIPLLTQLESTCIAANKTFMPAVLTHDIGIVGPLCAGNKHVRWRSMWDRITHSTRRYPAGLAGTTTDTPEYPLVMSMLANILVFELLKQQVQVPQEVHNFPQRFYTMNAATLEGKWHEFIPHLAMQDDVLIEDITPVEQVWQQTEIPSLNLSELFAVFTALTSPVCGIFYEWNEGDLAQMPVAQCRVQVQNPYSNGRTTLLTELVCAGLTHEDARREAGLAGLEAYIEALVQSPVGSDHGGVSAVDALHVNVTSAEVHTDPHPKLRRGVHVGVGVGSTITEAVWRGLHQALDEELKQQVERTSPKLSPLHISNVEDKTCQFYLEVLQTLHATPKFYYHLTSHGFPTVWAQMETETLGTIGLNITTAMQHLLEQLVLLVKGSTRPVSKWLLRVPGAASEMGGTSETSEQEKSTQPEAEPISTAVPSGSVIPQASELRAVMARLTSRGYQMEVSKIGVEPYLNSVFPGIFQVRLRQEVSS